MQPHRRAGAVRIGGQRLLDELRLPLLDDKDMLLCPSQNSRNSEATSG
jgi:hypothetical protein